MFKIVISDEYGRTTTVASVQDEITIGRGEDNTVCLNERNVSRKHARLRQSNGGIHVEDLKSYNGVRVNGKRIEQDAVIHEGDKVTVGDFVLEVKVADVADTDVLMDPTKPVSSPPTAEQATVVVEAPAPPISKPPPIRPYRLVLLTGSDKGKEFEVVHPISRVGRESSLEICLPHKSISREHAEIIYVEDQIRILDLGSANGMRVNRRACAESLLQPGDLVDLGQLRLRVLGPDDVYNPAYEYESAVTAPPRGRRSGGWLGRVALVLGIVGAAGAALVLAFWKMTPQATENEAGRDGKVRVHVSSNRPVPEVGGGTADARFEEYLSHCQTALSAMKYRDAVQYGTEALKRVPGSPAAQQCAHSAQSALAEQNTFEAGKQALAQGDVENAYVQFEGLPLQSAYRGQPEVIDTMKRFAQGKLAEAKTVLDEHPDEAMRLASIVLQMSPVPEPYGAEAVKLQQAARRRQRDANEPRRDPEARSAVEARAPATGAVSATNAALAAAPASGDVPFEVAKTCLSRGDQWCAIRALEGKTRSARELALLVESYRSVGDTPRMVRSMSDFVVRFPNAPQASAYREFLARHGQ
jgi:pSer/pThr/pTyr-binding forkhead associated (FHA) protein